MLNRVGESAPPSAGAARRTEETHGGVVASRYRAEWHHSQPSIRTTPNIHAMPANILVVAGMPDKVTHMTPMKQLSYYENIVPGKGACRE